MSYAPSYPCMRDCPVDDLTLSEMNPRKTVDPDSITALAKSILVCGLMQNLAGLVDDAGKAPMIVAGGRRLRALQQLRKAGEGPEFVPVLLTDDVEQARAWAMAENAARTDLNPADEISAYAAMARSGQGIPQIAAAFGVTEMQVQRRLKLATLDEATLGGLRAGDINLSQAAALLMCDGEAQREDYVEQARRGIGGEQLRRMILSDRVRGTDRRVQFVGLPTYREAGGALTTDLFSSEVVIEDVALLDRLFAEATDARREELIADGWAWAEFQKDTWLPIWDLSKGMDRIYPARGALDSKSQQRYEHLTEKKASEGLDTGDRAELAVYEGALKPAFTTTQRAHAGVFFCVTSDGKLQVEEGFVRASDRAGAIAAGILRDTSAKSQSDANGADGAGDAPGFSQALLADLRAIRLSALQESILQAPQLARQVLAYGLAASTGRPFEVSIQSQPNEPKVTDGFRQADALQGDGGALNDWDHARNMPLDDLTAIIANRLIRGMLYGFSYSAPRPEWHDLMAEAQPDMRARWRPTKENFFSRVPVAYLDDLFCQIFDLDPKHADTRDFMKLKKGEKANVMHMLFDPEGSRKSYRLMTDTAMARIEAFVPEFE